MGWSIKWDDKEVQERLSHCVTVIGKKAHKLLQEGMLEVELRAKRRAPKKYGFLRASIGHWTPGEISGSPTNPPTGGGIWLEEFCSIEMGSGLAYARRQEYSISPHAEGESPFLTNSFNEVKPLVIKAAQDEMEAMVNGQ